ncbi:MAG: ABC transporter permease, partial [Planctomycetota bacterium]
MRGPSLAAARPDVISLLKNLIAGRRLLLDFVSRDLRARYVGSSLGFFWSVIYPVMNLAVYVFVFNIVLKTTWGPDQSPLEVVLLMLVGIVAWSAFSESLSRAANILVDNANLIEKVVFPSAILPAFVVGSALVNMAIAIPVVGLVLVYAMLNPTTDPSVLASAAETGNLGVQVGLATLCVPAL